MSEIAGELINCYDRYNQLYRVFKIDNLELLLFSNNHFQGGTPTGHGDVCTRLYSEQEEYVKVGTWKRVNKELKMKVFQLGCYIADISGFEMSPVHEYAPANPLEKIETVAIVKQSTPENTELSLFILNKLFVD